MLGPTVSKRWELTFRLARCNMYREAGIGLLPISWGSLGLGHCLPVFAFLRAGPLETLALEEMRGIMEYGLALDHCFETHRRFTEEMRELRDAHRAARAARAEQARHYGMLVCRAFFQTATVSQGMPDLVRSRAYAQEVVELVEEFLNG